MTTNKSEYEHNSHYDRYLLFAVVALVIFGLLVVTSASIPIAERQYGQPFFYLIHQSVFVFIGFILATVIVRIPMCFWHKNSALILIAGIFMLVLVLIPGIGKEINGSRRWLGIGSFGIQVSEFIKLAFILYISSFIVNFHEEVRTKIVGFTKPMTVLGFVSLLLIFEPDFGTIVVLAITSMSLLFMGGTKLWRFAILFLGALFILWILVIASPYRVARLTSFLNPWADQYGKGYQLTQSLIAFGRGGFWGVGLGESVQKLFYLPEAQTDFLFAVLAEELGLIGVIVIIFLYVVIISRALAIGRSAQLKEQHMSGFVAYGIAVWLCVQAFINMGVNAGMLPTKGLTLPLVSYGGSSMLVVLAAIAILFRIDYESR